MPRDGTRTRNLLLDAAEQLVLQNGFASTSVEAILEASGSSKGAFFHHFENKRALAQALVVRYVDADLEMLERGLAAVADEPDPTARLLGFLQYYETWADDLAAEDTNCLYIATLNERDLLDADTAAELGRGIGGWRTAISALVSAAYDANRVVDGPDAADLADHVFVTFEGAFLMCRAERSAEPMRRQLRVLRQLVASTVAPGAGSPG